MVSMKTSSNHLREIAFYSIFFLFSLQILTDFIEAVYAFALFGSDIPPELAVMVVLFSPLILLFLPHGLPRGAILGLGGAVLLSRAVEVMLDTRGQMLVSAVGIACLLLFLPALLKNLADRQKRNSYNMAAGLMIAISLAILLRALGAGLDISVDGSLRWLGWLLALIAGMLLPGIIPPAKLLANNEPASSIPTRSPASDQPAGEASAVRVAGLSIGIISVFISLFYTFTNPAVLVRWAESSYTLVFAGIFTTLFVFSLLFTSKHLMRALLKPVILLAWNSLFILAMVFSILPRQLQFPADVTQYPLYEPGASNLVSISVTLMIGLFPVIILDFYLLSRQIIDLRPSWRKLGAGFSVAALYLLIMILAHIFTTTYDYIPVVGPFFRDRYWLVYLIAGLGLALPLLLVSNSSYARYEAAEPIKGRWLLPAVLALSGLITTIALLLASVQPVESPSAAGTLRVFTYNVQQGYSAADQRNYDGQIALIRSKNPDILGLQESDSLRIANGNADLVRYFADQLNMFAYYGPNPITGTFGVALLSKYPIQNPRTFYMFSEGEQTGAIIAQISANGKTYNVYVTHLGNDGPIYQQEAILRDVAGKDNVILMGDFNFRPESEQYQLTTQSLLDAWMVKWPAGAEDNGLILEKRIDHVFISPQIGVSDARYLTDPQSDHPAMFVELR